MPTLLVSVVVLILATIFILWLIDKYVPLPQPVKTVVECVIAVLAIVILLFIVGVFHIG